MPERLNEYTSGCAVQGQKGPTVGTHPVTLQPCLQPMPHTLHVSPLHYIPTICIAYCPVFAIYLPSMAMLTVLCSAYPPHHTLHPSDALEWKQFKEEPLASPAGVQQKNPQGKNQISCEKKIRDYCWCILGLRPFPSLPSLAPHSKAFVHHPISSHQPPSSTPSSLPHACQGFILDGIPATEAGFRKLEHELSGYDDARKLVIKPKLLLPHPPPIQAAPPPGPSLEKARQMAEDGLLEAPRLEHRRSRAGSQVMPGGGDGPSKSRKGSVTKGAKPKPAPKLKAPEAKKGERPRSVVDKAEDAPAAQEASEAEPVLAPPPEDENPSQDVSGFDLVLHVDVPNQDIFLRFAGQRQDPADGQLYHMEYKPPPLERVAALQPVDRPSASDQAMLQEKLMVFNHETKRVKKWLEKYGIMLDVQGDCKLDNLQADIMVLIQHAMQVCVCVCVCMSVPPPPPGHGGDLRYGHVHLKAAWSWVSRGAGRRIG